MPLQCLSFAVSPFVCLDAPTPPQTVKEALEAPLPEVSRPEVQLAKAELDNHTIVHQLTDALSKVRFPSPFPAKSCRSSTGDAHPYVLWFSSPTSHLSIVCLSQGAPSGDVGFLDLSTVDAKTLLERIQAVEELGVHTKQAEALVAIAKIIRRVRLLMVCILDGHLPLIHVIM